jgi:hypothetical protein
MRAWFGVVFDFEARPYVTPDTHPIVCLTAIEGRSPAKARAGLEMAINDSIEEAAGWPDEKIRQLDAALEKQHLPSFTVMRLRFSRQVSSILRRGSIHSEAEYYAVRNAVELFPENDRQCLAELLATYERNSVKPT